MSTFAELHEQFRTNELAIAYLRQHHILRNSAPLCLRDDCQRAMREVKDSSRMDGYVLDEVINRALPILPYPYLPNLCQPMHLL